MKVARGLLPELVEVSLEKDAAGGVSLTRTGSTAGEQPVLVRITQVNAAGFNDHHHYPVLIPAGSATTTVTVQELTESVDRLIEDATVSVVNAGSDYIAGTPSQIEYRFPSSVRAAPEISSPRHVQVMRRNGGYYLELMWRGNPEWNCISLMDAEGSIIHSEQCIRTTGNNLTIALKGPLSTGLYIVALIAEDKTHTRRVLFK
jgi:hypothetical protein